MLEFKGQFQVSSSYEKHQLLSHLVNCKIDHCQWSTEEQFHSFLMVSLNTIS